MKCIKIYDICDPIVTIFDNLGDLEDSGKTADIAYSAKLLVKFGIQALKT